jgi:Bacterial Ig domain
MKKKAYRNNLLLCVCGLIVTISGCKKDESDNPSLPVNTTTQTTKAATMALTANTVYIDPQYTGTKSGTQAQPYNSWADITWKAGYTYLFKCGSTYTTSTSLRPGASSITIGSYGTGARPIISSSVGNGSKVFDLGSLKDMTIQDLEVISTNNAQSCFHFINSVRGSVINCKIHGSEWGIRNVASTGLFRIINCEIYLTGDDGSYNESYDSIEVSGTYIHDVNQKYFVNTAETYSGGDCLQLHDVGYFYVHDNILDHSGTGNKFCFISENDNTLITTGTLERNVFKRSNEGNNVYIYSSVHNAIIRYNKFENAGIGIYNLSISAQIYYNEFFNISDRVIEGLSSSTSSTRFVNNTVYNVSKVIAECYNDNMTIQNNIIYNCYGQAFEGHANLKLDYNCYYQMSTAGISNLGTNSINADPQFNNIANLDFSLKSSSPCIDKGSNIMGSCIDLAGCAVPKGNAADMGALEYSSTVTTPVNKPPVVSLTTPANNSTFTAPANISLTASASDPDGSISKVEYYNGAVKIGESLTAPYTLTWSNVAAGTYSLTAVATDNLNSKTTSAVVTISVNSPTTSNTPPVVKITNPSNGLNITSGSSLKITANASAANGSVSKVEFYNGATKLGESSTAPYSYTWSNIPHGTYAISAVATDNLNSKTTSKSVALWVN